MTTMTSNTKTRPSEVRIGAAHHSDALSYAIGESALGKILVARSTAGVCAILFGSSVQDLKDDLAERFPGSKLSADQGEVRSNLAQLIRHIEDPAAPMDFNLEIRGTAFQKRVWETIRKVPAGKTVTYTDLAARMGMPKAFRAVAQACSANAIAVAIPCHRVLRSDGSLGGYRWGVERKRELLRMEASV